MSCVSTTCSWHGYSNCEHQQRSQQRFLSLFHTIMRSGKTYETGKIDGTVGGHIYPMCQTETDDETKPKDQAI